MAVRLNESGGWEAELFREFAELWEKCRDASLILVDIPIGLKEHGLEERRCDKHARQLLGPQRRSSVFPAPCRQALRATSFPEAGDINERVTGRRLSQQTWAILPKIRQVDQFLLANPDSQDRIREVHPEVCFWALAGRRPLQYSKSKRGEREQGLAERYEVLHSLFPSAGEVINFVLSNYLRRQVKKDDVLDTLAAAVTALLGRSGLSTIPEHPEVDARGIVIEMVYFVPKGT